MPEVEAAIATEQLKKLPTLLKHSGSDLANYLTEKLSHLDFLTPPTEGCQGSGHVYYLYPLKYHEEATGLARKHTLA